MAQDRYAQTTGRRMAADIDEIIGNFALLDDWEDRYRYLIELGRALEPLPEAARTEENRVRGCVSQVWLETTRRENAAGAPMLVFRGDSDALIVRGLVALVLALFSERPADEIAARDPAPVFRDLGLAEHLTPQRANGLRAMIERIRNEARSIIKE